MDERGQLSICQKTLIIHFTVLGFLGSKCYSVDKLTNRSQFLFSKENVGEMSQDTRLVRCLSA